MEPECFLAFFCVLPSEATASLFDKLNKSGNIKRLKNRWVQMEGYLLNWVWDKTTLHRLVMQKLSRKLNVLCQTLQGEISRQAFYLLIRLRNPFLTSLFAATED